MKSTIVKFLAPFIVAALSLVGGQAWADAAKAAAQYEIGPGDKIQIRVYKHADLDTLLRVSANGTIRVPLVGEITVAGLGERDAELAIAQGLERGGYVNEPQVTVFVEEYESRQASVLGYVNRPGRYVISPRGSPLVDMLAMAGGVTAEGADVAFLTRRGATGTVTTEIDLVATLERGDQSRNLDVTDGDVLYVPPMRTFHIYGAVSRPGKYRLDRGTTVMKALAVAGGLYVEGQRAQGSESGIEIRRAQDNGTVKTIDVELESLVQPGDLIRVKEKLF